MTPSPDMLLVEGRGVYLPPLLKRGETPAVEGLPYHTKFLSCDGDMFQVNLVEMKVAKFLPNSAKTKLYFREMAFSMAAMRSPMGGWLYSSFTSSFAGARCAKFSRARILSAVHSAEP